MKKLRNKKTGEIINNNGINFAEGNYKTYNSLAELNAEWEDYEEPKEHYILNGIGIVRESTLRNTPKYRKEIVELIINNNKPIGNYFNTREEAEKAVEKLKAWKRLKDKGFRFCGWATNEGIRGVDFEVPDSFFSEHNHSCISDETRADLDLLFGGEE